MDKDLEDVRNAFNTWNDALQTLDPKQVAALYAPGGVLLPTVSNKVRTTPAEITAYFTDFLQLKPKGKIDESHARMLAPETGIHSGIYTFQLVKDGKDVKVQARFSFTYKKVRAISHTIPDDDQALTLFPLHLRSMESG